jgi:hypothetical protein
MFRKVIWLIRFLNNFLGFKRCKLKSERLQWSKQTDKRTNNDLQNATQKKKVEQLHSTVIQVKYKQVQT